jgi:hypothetical protein
LPNPEVADKVANNVANSCVSVSSVSTSCLADNNSGGSSDVGGGADSVGKQDKAVWR